MARLSLSDIVEAQAAQVETLLAMVRDLTTQQAVVLAALTAPRQATASEELTLSRSKLADKATGVGVKGVRQADESVEEWALRGSAVFENECARYPLPNGAAHAAELGDGLDKW